MNNIRSLIDNIGKINKFQQKYLKKSFLLLTDQEKDDFRNYVTYCESVGKSVKFLANAYNLMTKSALKEQIYFKKYDKYRFSRLAEVEDSIYNNKEYMEMYMYGLAVSSFLWKQHIEISRFYNEVLPTVRKGQYLEIGPGHGYFFIKTIQKSSYSYFEGIDISPISAEITKNILNSKIWGQFSNYKINVGDFLCKDCSVKYDAIVMGEVLEHVDKPWLMLDKIVAIAKRNSFIFVTTCINSPMIDHIYLFREIEEVEDLLKSSGLFIKNRIFVPCEGVSIEQSLNEKLPVNVAYKLSI